MTTHYTSATCEGNGRMDCNRLAKHRFSTGKGTIHNHHHFCGTHLSGGIRFYSTTDGSPALHVVWYNEDGFLTRQ